MTQSPTGFDFRNLFILDLANNHQGSVEHGLAIIRRVAEVVTRHGVRAAIKFQFRDLPAFVHKDELSGSANKHVPRFLSTRLTWEQFGELLEEIRRQGLLAMCTPFDEASVRRVSEMGFDLVKVASCSARDWPLIAAIAGCGLPVVASTGGLDQSQVDDLVSFLRHRGCDFALMHCVSLYPTPEAACNLDNIAGFKERYGGIPVGWSTHEDPADTVPVQLAAAVGAELFERHIGMATETIKLNAYSSTPEQIDAWITAWKKAKTLLGQRLRPPPSSEERVAIDELRRGVFARKPIAAGQMLEREDVYFAFPYRPGQLSSGEWCSGILATQPCAPDAPLMADRVQSPNDPDVAMIKSAIHEVKALLNQARVPLSAEFTVEYSHHYGVSNFRKYGAVLINVINREYCKKVLVQLPGQMHPHHFHKRKEETFLILWGELHSEVDGRHRVLHPGDTLLILPGVWHRFWTETGCVFEEISTTHYANDSVYRDARINNLDARQRKTVVDHWGRFQLFDQLGAVEPPPLA